MLCSDLYITFLLVLVILMIFGLQYCLAEHMHNKSLKNKSNRQIKAVMLVHDLSPLYKDWIKKTELNGHADNAIKTAAHQRILERVLQDL